MHGELHAAQAYSISLLSRFAQSLCCPPGTLVIKILEMQTFVPFARYRRRLSHCKVAAACHLRYHVAVAAPVGWGMGGEGSALTTTIRHVYTKAQK